MIRSLYRSEDGRLRTDLTPLEIGIALQDARGLLWVDFAAEAQALCEPILLETFGFHHLAVEDALQQSHVPKVDDWGEYLYIVLHAVVFDRDNGSDVDTLELDIFLGRNYMVTYHDRPVSPVDRLWAACRRDERHLTKGSDHLLYRLADELVAGFMPVVGEIDDAIELIQDEIFDSPAPATLQRVFMLKRGVLHLRRILAPEREVLNKLARDDYAVVDAASRIFFRDVYDHLIRLHDITESMRDLLGGAVDTYLSVVNNRMNEVMKTLTIITTLFMPISFVAGFFGMNFFQAVTPQDVWMDRPAFVLTMLALIVVPMGMYLWVRRRGWA